MHHVNINESRSPTKNLHGTPRSRFSGVSFTSGKMNASLAGLNQADTNPIHPGKLTWNPKMEVWKMIFLFNWVILRFHVNFQGCKQFKGSLFPS